MVTRSKSSISLRTFTSSSLVILFSSGQRDEGEVRGERFYSFVWWKLRDTSVLWNTPAVNSIIRYRREMHQFDYNSLHQTHTCWETLTKLWKNTLVVVIEKFLIDTWLRLKHPNKMWNEKPSLTSLLFSSSHPTLLIAILVHKVSH